MYWDPRRDLAVCKHSHRPPSYRIALDGIAGQVRRHPPKGGYYCGPGGDPRGLIVMDAAIGMPLDQTFENTLLLGSSVSRDHPSAPFLCLTCCYRRHNIRHNLRERGLAKVAVVEY